MKYKFILPFAFFVLCVTLTVHGQKDKTFNEIEIRDSIQNLLEKFGQSFDLHYEKDGVDFQGFKNRENNDGNNLFLSLFNPKIHTENIVNFISPVYIQSIDEIENCKECRDEIIKKLRENKSYTQWLSVAEYVELYRNVFLTEGISSQILEGAGGTIDLSQKTWNARYKRSYGQRYKTNISAPLSFWGMYLDENNKQTSFDIEKIDLVFEISFVRIKNSEGTYFSDFKIDRISDHLIIIDDEPNKKYMFSLTPTFSVGSQAIDYTIENNNISESIKDGNAWDFSPGLLLEYKIKPFNSNYLNLIFGTGVEFKYSNIKTSLKAGYSESNSAENPPFAVSTDLVNYSLESETGQVDFVDSHWFVGIPAKIGLGFPLKRNNSIRGYLNSTFTYLIPISESTEANGDASFFGKYLYVHNGAETEIMMGEGTVSPEVYGEKSLFSNQSLELKSGFQIKTQLGFSIPFENNSHVDFGPYFLIGSYTLKNTVQNNLIRSGGEISSPLNAATKLGFTGYGIHLSVSFDYYRFKLKK